jgi:hypothetical protein
MVVVISDDADREEDRCDVIGLVVVLRFGGG